LFSERRENGKVKSENRKGKRRKSLNLTNKSYLLSRRSSQSGKNNKVYFIFALNKLSLSKTIKMSDYGTSYIYIGMFGKTGVGKSTLGNHLSGVDGNARSAFKTAMGGKGETTKPQYHSFRKFGETFNVVDTAGMMDGKGRDADFLKDLEQFFKTKAQHLNGALLLLNFQEPRFDSNTIKILKLVHKMFKDAPNFWTIFRVVFTKTSFQSYQSAKEREDLKNTRRSDATKELRSLTGDSSLNPFFTFIDTKDPSPQTTQTLDEILIWCKSNPAVPSKFFKPPPPKQIATETKREKEGDDEVTYQRKVFKDHQGKKSFGKWERTSSRTHPDVLQERESRAKTEADEAKKEAEKARKEAEEAKRNSSGGFWKGLVRVAGAIGSVATLNPAPMIAAEAISQTIPE